MPVLSGHLFKINLRNYHSARVPSLGFYNFIFLLQCLYPRAPQFISAAQPRWIINRGREQKDDERHKRSIIHTQPHTFDGGGGSVLLSVFPYFYISTVLLKSDIPCFSLARLHGEYVPHMHSHPPYLHTHVCLLCPSSIPSGHFSWGSRGRKVLGWGCGEGLRAAPRPLRSLCDTASWQAFPSIQVEVDLLRRGRQSPHMTSPACSVELNKPGWDEWEKGGEAVGGRY